MESRQAPVPSFRHTRQADTSAPTGEFVTRDGETYYRISAFHRLDPFLMTLASDTDLWMFVTSGGGLTAGRVDPDGSLFPYRTVDQLHEAHHHTGPITLIRVDQEDGGFILWKPFSTSVADSPDLDRNLYKNTVGNRLDLRGGQPRTRPDLQLQLGRERRVRLGADRHAREHQRRSGAAWICWTACATSCPTARPSSLYQQSSNLVDAYKKSEIDAETGLGIFSLSAGITDRAEALESLQANIVWCCGLEDYRVHLSAAAIKAFRHGRVVAPGHDPERGPGQLPGQLRTRTGAGRQCDRGTWSATPAGTTPRSSPCGAVCSQDADLAARHRRERRADDGESPPQRGQRRRPAAVGPARILEPPFRQRAVQQHARRRLRPELRRPGGRLHSIFSTTRNRAVADRWQDTLAALPDTITVDELRAAGPRIAATPISNASVTSTCPFTSAAATATPAGPGTAFPSACATAPASAS